MEGHEQLRKSRVIKVNSEQRWDFLLAQAGNQGCPVVVHFTTAWCIPSVAMKPLFEDLAQGYPNVVFLSVDVDEVKEVASKMEVKAMPTFVLMREGAQVDKLVGANPAQIKKLIGEFVSS
ncbi:hypothetical protein RJ639_045670 [Escallonia herrerae]|uniref:Thioredoxin domain-containing protein n=1 Tax=Escallonia herrerae TaxID=1293975 RepID=A0AA89AZY9_9ASTE|nr:hypothetical protein RJ639_045670 [Escallonia herrerae]